MPVGEENERPIARTVAAHLARGLQQLLDRRRRQVFAGPPIKIFGSARGGDSGAGGRSRYRRRGLRIASARGNLPIFEHWREVYRCCFSRGFYHRGKYNTAICGHLWECQVRSKAVDHHIQRSNFHSPLKASGKPKMPRRTAGLPPSMGNKFATNTPPTIASTNTDGQNTTFPITVS